jgi:RNA polymerase sigma-70 factor, ECF subfamily
MGGVPMTAHAASPTPSPALPQGGGSVVPPYAHADTGRLRAMVDAHWVSIGRITRTLGVPEAEIEDALQHVFIVAAQKLAVIDLGKERAFLVQVAVNVAARVRRRHARSREELDETIADASDTRAASPEDRLDRDRALSVLVCILDAMDDAVRDIFVLHEIEEMTMADIATTLEVAPGTVASRLRRAREQFERSVARVQRGAR